jgi:DNA modification methylase
MKTNLLKFSTVALSKFFRYPVSHVDTAIRHPHEKPVDFWQNCLWLPGVLAVDPFCGTGNMLRAAKNLGRKAIGIEREEKWCEAAARNMQQQVFAL